MYVRYLNKKPIDLKQKKILKKLVLDKKLLRKKGVHANYSIIQLKDYYLRNLKYLPEILK